MSDQSPLSTSLFYKDSGSDKVYQAQLEPRDAGWVVNFAFGRRGSTLQTGTKTAKPVAYDVARKAYDKIVGDKLAKGYTPGESASPYQHTDREQRVTGVLPQLLNAIEEVELLKLLGDDDYWMQGKVDGKRILIRKLGSDITGINRKGLSVGLPQPIVEWAIAHPCDGWLLDGECVGETFHTFDVLEYAGRDLREKPYRVRFKTLDELKAAGPVRPVATALDAKDKQSLLDRLRGAGREGVVFKRHDAPYKVGRPPKGGTQLKYKFYATASCLVAKAHATKRSVSLEVLDGGAAIAIGNVTIPANQPIPEVGEIVEVRYLYAYPAGSLFQPTYLGLRDDVSRAQCTAKQLKYRAENEEDDA